MHTASQVLQSRLPVAREGLQERGIAATDIDRDRDLDVISVRLRTGRNGAAWQMAHHAQYGDLRRITADCLAHQRSGMPV